ncbi:DMT family transporter [Ketogulonicigenium vulgare]|uniref:Drug/metabolite transporter (DMT) permease superfamily protein n=1 Tax=Ketogulonicigenium vulgare (strain WSH-001) TaxID=759362 RepID=F9Y5K3_KETVW|nr:DMT family transporter [Ketogulonicigenium vulgare]ADO42562.1 inner membrane transporter yiJE [Ketogulonicigenium vulgare Y25]AEM40756.1 Drug/metabolite transporter (DMT) permease superfamily protein [Ketogulonicigenium vulgare WSH-001]ALJ80925.1 hypothetical protein KVH_06870 [Ketogulonicigenium vulgare]ANW33696.1 hypothetical protein KvSKV_06840 [Ketogulonicigenium vulgare]AOZ54474.1 inner membrane transporter yiJE [Ketogulonicigenium vulgare]
MSDTHHTPSLASARAPLLDQRAKTVLWLLAMVMLWGLSWPATQVALLSVPPVWLAALRFGSAGICLFIFVALRGELRLPPKADWPIVISIGFLQMMAFTGMGMIAMTTTETSHSVLLAYTTPLWSVVMAFLLFRQAPTHAQFGALAVGLVGVGLIVSPLEMDWSQPGVLRGALLLIGGAVSWSVVILHVRRHRWQSSPLQLAPWQMLLATVPLASIAFLTEGAPVGINFTPELIQLLVFIGPIATSACFVISAEQGRRITPFAMANFTLGVPLVGITASVILLGNQLSPVFLTGLALVTLGMGLAARAARGR